MIEKEVCSLKTCEIMILLSQILVPAAKDNLETSDLTGRKLSEQARYNTII